MNSVERYEPRGLGFAEASIHVVKSGIHMIFKVCIALVCVGIVIGVMLTIHAQYAANAARSYFDGAPVNSRSADASQLGYASIGNGYATSAAPHAGALACRYIRLTFRPETIVRVTTHPTDRTAHDASVRCQATNAAKIVEGSYYFVVPTTTNFRVRILVRQDNGSMVTYEGIGPEILSLHPVSS